MELQVVHYWTVHYSSSGFSVHHDSLVSIKQQPYEHVQLCCPDMESLPIEKYKCKPTDNIFKSWSEGDESLCWKIWVPSRQCIGIEFVDLE